MFLNISILINTKLSSFMKKLKTKEFCFEMPLLLVQVAIVLHEKAKPSQNYALHITRKNLDDINFRR